MSTAEVVAFGEVMGLILASDGPMTTATRADLGCAGAEATVAVGLSRLGHRVEFFGRVGADAFGRRVRRTLAADGVGVAGLVDDRRPTGLLLRDRVIDRPIDVTYARTGTAGSALETTDVPVETIRAARVLFASGITAALSPSAAAATTFALKVARDAGTTVVVDPNVRRRLAGDDDWRRIAEELAALADVVLVGRDDARVICGDADPVDWFRERGTARIVVKSGTVGATEVGPDGSWSAQGRRVEVVDPVGAGDAFAAGWVSAHLRGVSAERRLREAHVVASCTVGHPGDLDGLPTADVRDLLLDEDGPDVLR